MGDGAVRLLPDFRGGGGVVRGGIRGVAVLVRIEIFVASGFVDFAHAPDGAVGAFVAGRVDDVHAVGCENVFAFGRGADGKAEFHAIAERGADHGVGDSGVAAGWVEDYFPGAQVAGEFAGADHGVARAIFHGAAGIEPFAFGVKFYVGGAGDDTLEPQEWSVADSIEQMDTDFRGVGRVVRGDGRFVGCVHGAWILFLYEARASGSMRFATKCCEPAL